MTRRSLRSVIDTIDRGWCLQGYAGHQCQALRYLVGGALNWIGLVEVY